MSSVIAKVEPNLQSPAAALIFVAFFDSLLLLLPLGSTVAFNSIVGIATIGFQTSYALPILLKLLCKEPFPLTPFDLGYYTTNIKIFILLLFRSISILLFHFNWNVISFDVECIIITLIYLILSFND